MEGGKEKLHRANKHRWMHQTTTLRSLLKGRNMSSHSPVLSRCFLASLQFCKPGQYPPPQSHGIPIWWELGLQLLLDTQTVTNLTLTLSKASCATAKHSSADNSSYSQVGTITALLLFIGCIISQQKYT